MRERDATRKYLLELASSMALYIVVLYFSLTIARKLDPGVMRTVLMLSPMIPIGLALWAVLRQLRRSDEFQRLRSLEALAIAGGITAGFSLTYGFLEGAGYPKLGMFVVWMVFCGSWGVVSCARSFYCRFASR
jgi:hypothetical protein